MSTAGRPNMLLRAIPLFLILCSLRTHALAQKTFKGRVIDAQTGHTLPAAHVVIKGTYKGTITNDDGRFTITIKELPATLQVRYLGFQSEERRVTSNSESTQDFRLQPASVELDEIIVTDEDPGERIMREVIRRKQQWRQELNTYKARAYNRQNLANDTAIVSISESTSHIYWDKQRGSREIITGQRQTSNLTDEQNFAGVRYLPNFYDDNIEIAGFKVVGPTHPDALDYYHFKLQDRLSIDSTEVYKIEVTPQRKLQPLFKGTLYVLEGAYALLEVDLQPNDVVRFPAPIKSFGTAYQQQFSNFGGEFWLPVDVRITGDIKIKMVGLEFPMIRFKQVSRITDYQVNIDLPDSLYRSDKTVRVDSSMANDSTLAFQNIETVPLSNEEEQAYSRLDSTQTLEKAFKPSGFLANMIDDEDDDTSESGLPGELDGFTPRFRYNRVDALHAGLKWDREITDRFHAELLGGYSTGYQQWSYGGGVVFDIASNHRWKLEWNYLADTHTRYESAFYSPFVTSTLPLLGGTDYFDYFRSEGWSAHLRYESPQIDTDFQLGWASKDHNSLDGPVTHYDLLGKTNRQRNNPAIEEGQFNAINLIIAYGDQESTFGITGQKSVSAEIVHSSPDLNSDFDFTTYRFDLTWHFNTFYQRRFIPNGLDIKVGGGTYSGDLPPQQRRAIDGSLSYFSPFGTLKTLANRPYEAKQYLSFYAEHHFRTIPFEWIGWNWPVERNWGVLLFGGAARSWNTFPQWPSAATYPIRTLAGWHSEVGISLNGILDLFRIDMAHRLDRPGTVIRIGVARMF